VGLLGRNAVADRECLGEDRGEITPAYHSLPPIALDIDNVIALKVRYLPLQARCKLAETDHKLLGNETDRDRDTYGKLTR